MNATSSIIRPNMSHLCLINYAHYGRSHSSRYVFDNISQPIIASNLADARKMIARHLDIPSVLMHKEWEVEDGIYHNMVLVLRYRYNSCEGVLYFDVYESAKSLNQI